MPPSSRQRSQSIDKDVGHSTRAVRPATKKALVRRPHSQPVPQLSFNGLVLSALQLTTRALRWLLQLPAPSEREQHLLSNATYSRSKRGAGLDPVRYIEAPWVAAENIDGLIGVEFRIVMGQNQHEVILFESILARLKVVAQRLGIFPL